ncbi:RNA polymerase sigma factor [Maribacter sp. R77961]|uniref:RNA polymerase sigma factor n=1 Tax=Maribacter sp. R77961 TaxID=3093871 RepID=UPI0037C9D1D4
MTPKEKKYKEIYKENYPKVMRLCMGYVSGNHALAKDVVQDVFIKIWENLEQFRNESGIGTWIYRITVNTCLTQLRNQKKYANNYDVKDIPELHEAYSGEEKHQMLVQLYTCINKLSETNKAIILLELEGLPQKQISDIIGIKHEAIRTRIHRIKSQLTKCVNNE